MTLTGIAPPTKQTGTFKSSTLLLIAFATVFFPRILSTLGAPSIINFVHLGVVPIVCTITLCTTKTKDRQQLAIVRELLMGLGGLLMIGFMSATLNGAGFINVVFDFLLAAEPFIFLLAWVSVPMTQTSLRFVLKWFFIFNIFSLLLALLQGATIGISDPMQGVFFFSGSGHVVASSIITTYGLFYFLSARDHPVWLRGLILGGCLMHLILADAKQVMLTLLIGFVILALINMKDIGKAFILLALSVGLIYLFYWAIYTFPALDAFKTWIRPEIYQPDGEATLLKTAGIRIIQENFQSPLNWLFGLGPGHTIDRLGFTVLKDFGHLLTPLGATVSTVSQQVSAAREASWLGDQSSFFSPFWGWAAIWGDLGLLGLGNYLYICSIIWRKICFDDFSKFVMLTVMLHGFIFTQLEEPGYMLFIAMLLSLHWQNRRQHLRT